MGHPESTIAVVKKILANDAIFEALKADVNRPAAEKKRKFNSDGNESHQDGGSDEQSEDEVASSGLNYIF